MEKYKIQELEKLVSNDLSKQTISGKILLDRFCMIDESSRKSPSYTDPNFAGFYYHLGKYVKPASLLEVGFELGLFSGSFLTSCKSVQRFCGYHESNPSFFSFRIGSRNIKKVFKGQKHFVDADKYDENFEKLLKQGWDMIIYPLENKYDRQLDLFEFFWPYLNENGIIVCDNIRRSSSTKEAFEAFVFSKNREHVNFETRHGTALFQK